MTTSTKAIIGVAACSLLLCSSAVFAAPPHFEGFEDPSWVPDMPDNWQNSSGSITRVTSGTNGIASATGNAHAVLGVTTNGPFTRFGGYSTTFQCGYVASQMIYLDTTWANNTGFDYSVAANGQDGNHRRDFIFHVGVASGNLLINADNNTYGGVNTFVLMTGNGGNNYQVTASGWYRFEHVFYDLLGDLAVDMNVYDASNSLVYSITRTDASDDIATVVGGNRYGWFVFNDIADLAIDDTSLQHGAGCGTLSLETTSCQDDVDAAAGYQIAVSLWMRDLPMNANGFQAFLTYDTAVLDYRGDLSSYTGAPFALHIQPTATAEVAPGEIRLDGSDNFNGPGTASDSKLATLVFDVVSECDLTEVMFDLTQSFDSELSLDGEPIATLLSNTGEFMNDDTPPVINCPPDISVPADAGLCTASVAIMPANWQFDTNASLIATGDPSNPYAVQLRSVATDPPGTWGPTGAAVWTPPAPISFDSITHVSADYNMLTGCVFGGSPRFVFGIDTTNDGIAEGYLVCNWGPEGSPWSDCSGPGWNNTGNLIASADNRWETQQLGGDTLDTYADVQALLPANADVVEVIIPLDAYWGQDQIMLLDNVQINSTVFTFGDASATDNCDAAPAVTGVRSDALPLTDPYPAGVTSITWTATDACGNSSQCVSTVTVSNTNLVDVEVELVGVFTPVSRCIHFVLDDCDAAVDATLSFVDHDSNAATPVRAQDVIEVPCGSWTSICAKDQQHTLWATSGLSIVGTSYMATSVHSLEPGDNDNDGDVDINDVTFLIANFGGPEAVGGCPWNGMRGTDFSNNGNVGSEDYSLLNGNWLTLSMCACTSSSTVPSLDIRKAIPVKLLEAELGKRVDLNNDGVFDYKDVRIFEQRYRLGHSLSNTMMPLPAPGPGAGSNSRQHH